MRRCDSYGFTPIHPRDPSTVLGVTVRNGYASLGMKKKHIFCCKSGKMYYLWDKRSAGKARFALPLRKREKFTSLTATGGSPHRRVATTPRREAVYQRHYTLTGVGLLCYEVRRVSHDLLLHSNASRIPFSQRTAGSSDRVPASSFLITKAVA